MAQFHPPHEWLLDWVAGQLNPAYALVLSAHVEQCSTCATRLQNLQSIGGALLQNLSPAELDDSAFERVWARTQSKSLEIIAPSISVTEQLHQRSKTLRWRNYGSVRKARLLNIDGVVAALLHIRAGAQMPMHTHSGNELTLILRGAFSDTYGRYQVGDMMFTDDTHTHAPVASANEDCLCLVAEQHPIKLTSPLLRLLNPLMQFV